MEGEAIGGQSASSSLIRNFPGFARGLSGAELARRCYQQSWVLGARFALMQRVLELRAMAARSRRPSPDHPRRAALAALALQRETARVASGRPDWPRFRVGVNTGTVLLTVLGTRGGCTHTAIGDAINIAARLQSRAPVGGVAVGQATAERLPADWTVPLGELTIKGKRDPLPAHLLGGPAVDPEGVSPEPGPPAGP